MTDQLSQYPKLSKFDKEVTWLKIKSEPLIYFDVRVNLNQIKKELDMKLSPCMKIVNSFFQLMTSQFF